ncbi:efflux RND transporter periplasmic adaptor subunit [Terriglobus sp.]|uniref:efflux RND transporter periplasmic adaptor subunit n=1 Tax=Terriglobus sp. TaxID=1889013 RepID=UPI003B000555
MRYTTRTLAITGFALAATLAGCKKKVAPEQDLPPINIETMTVQTGTASDTLSVPAHVEADPTKLVHVFPPLSGRIVSLRVVTGQEVSKGQTIATLQSADVAAARSDFEKAKTQAEHDDRARDRGKLLYDHEVLSLASYQDLQSEAAASHSELERARQRIHELGFSESGTSDTAPIASPIAGTVIDVGTANGELQRSLDNSSTNGIATIANLDSVWVVGDVFERDISALRSRESVDVVLPAFPGQTFHGSIVNIGDTFDPTTHTLRARVVLPNPGHTLKPAMFANLVISRPAQTEILVPQTAVVHDGDATGVYVEVSAGKYELRPVNVGATRGDTIAIRSGLRDGQRIVKKGAEFLRAPAAGD